MKESQKDHQVTNNQSGRQFNQEHLKKSDNPLEKSIIRKVMKRKIIFSAILFAGLMLVEFSVHQAYGQMPQNKPVKQEVVVYTCSHHPEIVQDLPGKCPKCGMALVEKKANAKGTSRSANDSTKKANDYNKKVMHDSTTWKKDHMKHDTVYRKHD